MIKLIQTLRIFTCFCVAAYFQACSDAEQIESQTSSALEDPDEPTSAKNPEISCSAPATIISLDQNTAFQNLCTGCHGTDGSGSGDIPSLLNLNYDRAVAVVRNGKGSMPKFNTEALSESDLTNMFYSLGVGDIPTCDQHETQTQLTEACSSENTIDVERLKIITNTQYVNILQQFFPDQVMQNASFSDALKTLPKDVGILPFDSQRSSLSFNHMSAISEISIELALLISSSENMNAFLDHNNISCNPLQNVNDCGLKIIDSFVSRIWRRPLSNDEADALLAKANAIPIDEHTGSLDRLASIIASPFTSSNFWFIDEDEGSIDESNKFYQLTSFEVATRLALTLTNRLPDTELWSIAANSPSIEDSVLANEFDRLTTMPATRDNFKHFTNQWLDLSHNKMPKFSSMTSGELDSLKYAAHDELGALVYQSFLNNETSEDLYTKDAILTDDPALLSIYSSPIQRPGLLTKAGLLFSETENPSSILRGVKIRTKILCDEISDPPPTAPTELPDPKGKTLFSSREALETATSQPSCAGCHDQINPLGVSFLSFDGMGFGRNSETVQDKANGQQVEMMLETSVKPQLNFGDLNTEAVDYLELTQQIAKHEKSKVCFAENIFRYVSGSTENKGHCGYSVVEKAYTSDKSLKEGLKAYILSPSFKKRAVGRK